MLADLEPWRFNEIVAATRLDPWGDDWLQTALIEAAIINKDRGDGEPVNPLDLIPNEDNRKKEQEPDTAAVSAHLRSMAGL